MDFIGVLDRELWEMICDHLGSARDLAKMASISQACKLQCSNDVLWRPHALAAGAAAGDGFESLPWKKRFRLLSSVVTKRYTVGDVGPRLNEQYQFSVVLLSSEGSPVKCIGSSSWASTGHLFPHPYPRPHDEESTLQLCAEFDCIPMTQRYCQPADRTRPHWPPSASLAPAGPLRVNIFVKRTSDGRLAQVR